MRATDCALLVTVPLDRSEFEADLTAGTDFITMFTGQQRTRDTNMLWSLYEPSAALIARTIVRAKRRGVAVWKRGTAADFARILEEHQVITLIAHWRTARFRASEVRDPRAVHRFLFGDRDDDAVATATAETMMLALNQRLDPDLAPEAPGAVDDSRNAAAETRRQYVMWHERRVLEPLLGTAVREGGPAVEFADGMVPVERVASAVPEAFEGVLDLTVCNSSVLAEEVRRRCRQGLIIANAFPATLQTRMQFYDTAIDRIDRQGLTYQDAVFSVRRELGRQS